MTTPLSQYRDIVKLLFAVTNYSAANRHELHQLLDKIHDILQKQENEYSPIAYMPSALYEIRPPTPPSLVIHPDQDAEGVVPNVVVTKEEPEIHEVRNLVVNLPPVVHAVKMEPTAPVSTPVQMVATGPPITDSDAAILSDLQRDMETLEENEIATPTATDACDEDEVAEDDVEDDADVEVEEEGEEAEEDEEAMEDEEAEEEEDEEEEDDDLELLKIKKQRYYWSPSSKRIYEYLEEGYGDCIGTYEDGKIIPKA